MSTLTIRLPGDTAADVEVRFKALAARGDAGQALAILDRLDAKGTASR